MGKYIKVDHYGLEDVAGKIEGYMSTYNSLLGQLGINVEDLGTGWEGLDFQTFKQVYNGEEGVKNAGQNLSKELLKQAQFLRYCAGLYKQAQADAVNRAMSLIGQ